MSGDGLFGYRYRKTIHSLSHHRNYDVISNYKCLRMSAGDETRGYRYQDTSHYYSRNCEFIIVMTKVVIMVEVDIGIKIPATITFAFVEQDLMLTGEVGIGLRPATITPITQVAVVDCQLYYIILVQLKKMFIVMIE